GAVDVPQDQAGSGGVGHGADALTPWTRPADRAVGRRRGGQSGGVTRRALRTAGARPGTDLAESLPEQLLDAGFCGLARLRHARAFHPRGLWLGGELTPVPGSLLPLAEE